MTVGSRPVLAARDCASIKVATSHDKNPNTSLACENSVRTAPGPSDWLANKSNWPSPYNATAG
jgi:hypothetical protein